MTVFKGWEAFLMTHMICKDIAPPEVCDLLHNLDKSNDGVRTFLSCLNVPENDEGLPKLSTSGKPNDRTFILGGNGDTSVISLISVF